MKRSFFRILGIALALCMALSLLPAAAAAGQTYGVAVTPCEHGAIRADKAQAAEGETVTVTAQSESSRYIVDRMWYVTDGSPSEPVYFNTTFTMPAENVTIFAEFTDEIPLITVLFKVNVGNTEHGAVSVSGPSSVNNTDFVPGSTVTVTAAPEPGYKVAAMFYTTRFDGDTLFFFAGTFMMPHKDVDVTVVFEPDPDAPVQTHSVTVIPTDNGSTSVDPTEAPAGETVVVKAIPDEGYAVGGMAYTRRDDADTLYPFDGSFLMPDCDVYVRVEYVPAQVAEPLRVVMTECVNGRARADKEFAMPGDTITVTALPDEGYVVDRMYYTRDDNSDVMTLFNTTFRMPECSVWVKVDFVSETPVIPVLYKINPLPAENGSFEADKTEAVPGETVTVTATPAEGYRVAGMSYTTADDTGAVVVFDGTFTMPYADVYVKVSFEPVPGGDPNPDPDDPDLEIDDPDIPLTSGLFSDVAEDAFYYDAVSWAVAHEITNGTGDGKFSPDEDCTREQVVTFLWRALGEPEPGIAESPFTDVAEDAYYYKPVLWAYENGITLGVSDTLFGVGKPCTREQVVTFLWRTSGQPEGAEAPSFSDVADGEWYEGAVKWAAAGGVTVGVGGSLFGIGRSCSRGQTVTFLFRALEG